jgi:hypothetical protein
MGEGEDDTCALVLLASMDHIENKRLISLWPGLESRAKFFTHCIFVGMLVGLGGTAERYGSGW